jgi:NADH-quinone oxidoreductase subunit B
MAESRLTALHVGEEREEGGAMLTTVDSVINWARKNSMWPMPMGLSCCAIEFMAAAASRFDISRFGAEVARFSPKQADVMIVAGTMTYKMGEAVRRLYDQMAEPKWVIAMGACASSAGMFRTYSVMQGIDHIVPVDFYIPGCPPRPEMLLNALIELQKRVGEDRSFRRTQAGILMGSGSKG